MKKSELITELQAIDGDPEVEISVAKQKESDQQYLIADARFVIPEEYTKEDGGPVVMIRDWPY